MFEVLRLCTLDPLRKLPLPTAAAVLDQSRDSSPPVHTSFSSSVAGELPLLPAPPFFPL